MAKTVKTESQYSVTLNADMYYSLTSFAKENLKKTSDELLIVSGKTRDKWNFEHALKAWGKAHALTVALEDFQYKAVEVIVDEEVTAA